MRCSSAKSNQLIYNLKQRVVFSTVDHGEAESAVWHSGLNPADLEAYISPPYYANVGCAPLNLSVMQPIESLAERPSLPWPQDELGYMSRSTALQVVQRPCPFS
jgi:hypothetical protein